MGALTSLGGKTKNTIFSNEGRKLSYEFTVAAANTSKAGQPMKMNAAGEVLPWTAADGESLLVGIAMTDQAAGELVTLWVRGFAIVNCISNAAFNCVPVTISSYDTSTDINGTTGYNKVAVLGGGGALEQIGWSLDVASGANQIVRVLIKN